VIGLYVGSYIIGISTRRSVGQSRLTRSVIAHAHLCSLLCTGTARDAAIRTFTIDSDMSITDGGASPHLERSDSGYTLPR